MEESIFENATFDDSDVEAVASIPTAQPGDVDMETSVGSYELVLCHYVYDEAVVRNDLESRRVHDRLNAMAGLYSDKCSSKTQEYRKGFGKWVKDIDFLLGQPMPNGDHEETLRTRLMKCRDKAQALDDLATSFLSAG